MHVSRPVDAKARRHIQRYRTTDPAFARRLATLYLDLNLLEAAGSLLHELRQAGRGEAELRSLEFEFAVRMGDHEGVLALGGHLAEEQGPSPWLCTRLAQAAFALGRRQEAEAAAVRALDYLPGNRDLAAILATEQGGTDRPEVTALVRDCARAGLHPHVTLDAVLPVLLDARPASCVFDDGVTFGCNSPLPPTDRRDALVGLTRHLYRTYGLRTAFLRYAAISGGRLVPMGKIYFARSQTLHEAVDALERLYWETFRLGTGAQLHSQRALAAEGTLLGYPPCCIAWAVELREAGRPFEREALAALVREECVAEAGEEDGVPPPSLAYFTFEFYPCDPRCPEAEAVGQHVLTTYRTVDPWFAAMCASQMTHLNKSRLWNATDLRPYREFVQAFNEHWLTLARPDSQHI